jgi:hypothetical protein
MKTSRIRSIHIFAVAVMGGIATSLVIQIVLARFGIELAGVWRNIFTSSAAQFRSAIAWWTIAGASLLGGFVVAFVASRFEWLYLRFLRGWLLALLTIGLALLARDLPRGEGVAPAAYALASAAALLVAFLMAAFGGFFALRR